MNKELRISLRRMLKRLGFDNSKSSPRLGVRVGCSQCQAAAINGTPCHETGCPNQRKVRR